MIKKPRKGHSPKGLMNVDVSFEGLLGATMQFLKLSMTSNRALSCSGLKTMLHEVKILH